MTHALQEQQSKKPSRRRPAPTHAIQRLDTKVVSLVDKPANGAPFVFVKAEGDPAIEPAPAGTAAADPATEQAPAAVAMAMPTEAKSKLSAAVKAACSQLEKVGSGIDGATEDDAASVPVEPLREIANAAMALAEAVRPFVPTTSAVTKADWTQEYEDTLSDWHFLYVIPGERGEGGKTYPLTNRKFPVRDHTDAPYLAGIAAAEEVLLGDGTPPWLTPMQRMECVRSLLRVRSHLAGEGIPPVPGKEADAAQGLTALAALAQKASALLSGAATQPPGEPAMDPAVQASTTEPVQQGSAAVDAATPAAGGEQAVTKALGQIHEVLKSIQSAVAGGQKLAPAAEVGGASEIQKSLADKEAELAELRKKLEDATVAVQKAKRAAPPSNQGPIDANDTAHSEPVYRPASGDMTEVWAEEERRASGRSR